MRSNCRLIMMLTLPIVFLAGVQTARTQESKSDGTAGPLV